MSVRKEDTPPLPLTVSLELSFFFAEPQNAEGKLEVTLVDSKSGQEVSKATYDSVFYATGRKADTSGIGLEAAGVKVRVV